MLRFLLRLSLPLLIACGFGIAWLDAQVQERFAGERWQLPSRIHARALEIHDGARIARPGLLRELKALGYRSRAGAPSPGTYSEPGAGLIIHTRGFEFPTGAEPARRIGIRWPGRDSAGIELSGAALVRLEPLTVGQIFPAHGEDRILLRLQDVPPLLIQGLLAVEDRDFHEHYGLSWRGIARASLVNLLAMRIVQGGSTLTQQLVKNLFLSQEQSLWRKGLEALMAVTLELRHGKEDILETYINAVFFAQQGRRAIHGFPLAAEYFTGSRLDQLAPEQIALLVGMVKAPSAYNPFRNPGAALRRRNVVLDVWEQNGLITPQQHAAYRARSLNTAEGARTGSLNFPHWRALIHRQLMRDYSPEELVSSGLRIFTSLDPQVQWQAEASLSAVLDRLEKGYPRAEQLQGAVVVSSVEGGEILALVGDRKPHYAGFNRALDARRPIGSLIKPVTYLAALEDGRRLGEVLQDEALTLPLDDGTVWSPRNFDGEFRGPVLLHEALYRSLNLPSLRLALDVGIDRLVQRLADLGVDPEEIPAVPALALGAISLSPIEVAELYGTIASGGFALPQRAILSVVDARGELLKRNPLRNHQVAAPDTMRLLQWALLQVANQGTARNLNLPKDTILAKTGTTNDFRDSWFVGISAEHVGVVWVGRDDNQSTSLSGSAGAMQIWGHLFRRLGIRPARLIAGGEIEFVWLKREDGLLSRRRCRDVVRLPQLRGARTERSPLPCR
ncbi:MAG: penicillin-binding protein 1B [Gammaproteobacteria bacterium AqS3]|nr:penicillin-binding protein 1B [Gammaproteobacteria bacterium AqS3]